MEELKKAAKDALEIVEGACNPRAIARALVKAIDAGCEQGKGSTPRGEHFAPARLMLTQLTYLMGTSFDSLGGSVHSTDGHIEATQADDTLTCQRLEKGE